MTQGVPYSTPVNPCVTCGGPTTVKYCSGCYGTEAIRFPCGHPRTEGNIYVERNTGPGKKYTYGRCRECRREKQRRYLARRRVS